MHRWASRATVPPKRDVHLHRHTHAHSHRLILAHPRQIIAGFVHGLIHIIRNAASGTMEVIGKPVNIAGIVCFVTMLLMAILALEVRTHAYLCCCVNRSVCYLSVYAWLCVICVIVLLLVAIEVHTSVVLGRLCLDFHLFPFPCIYCISASVWPTSGLKAHTTQVLWGSLLDSLLDHSKWLDCGLEFEVLPKFTFVYFLFLLLCIRYILECLTSLYCSCEKAQYPLF